MEKEKRPFVGLGRASAGAERVLKGTGRAAARAGRVSVGAGRSSEGAERTSKEAERVSGDQRGPWRGEGMERDKNIWHFPAVVPQVIVHFRSAA